MKVHGLEFSEKILAAGLDAMVGWFTAEDIRSAIAKAIPEDFNWGIQHKASVLDRCADRLLQKQRNLGRIAFRHGRWHQVKF